VTTDASAALESTTSAQNACQLLTIYIYSLRGPAARNAVRSYNRHHVINPPSTSLPYPARLPRGSDQVDPRHGRSREVPDVVDRMSELTGLRGRRQTSSSLAGLDYGGAVCTDTARTNCHPRRQRQTDHRQLMSLINNGIKEDRTSGHRGGGDSRRNPLTGTWMLPCGIRCRVYR